MAWYIQYFRWHVFGWGRTKVRNNEEHDEDCVEETLQLDSLKFDGDGERRREALGTGNCNINI